MAARILSHQQVEELRYVLVLIYEYAKGKSQSSKKSGLRKQELNKDDKKEANKVSTHRILCCTEPYTNMLKG